MSTLKPWELGHLQLKKYTYWWPKQTRSMWPFEYFVNPTLDFTSIPILILFLSRPTCLQIRSALNDAQSVFYTTDTIVIVGHVDLQSLKTLKRQTILHKNLHTEYGQFSFNLRGVELRGRKSHRADLCLQSTCETKLTVLFS